MFGEHWNTVNNIIFLAIFMVVVYFGTRKLGELKSAVAKKDAEAKEKWYKQQQETLDLLRQMTATSAETSKLLRELNEKIDRKG